MVYNFPVERIRVKAGLYQYRWLRLFRFFRSDITGKAESPGVSNFSRSASLQVCIQRRRASR